MLRKDRQSIQSMFARIAPRYDTANRLLSLRIDTRWRKRVAVHLLPAPGRVLDVASGTGDLALDLRRHGGHSVVSSDFTFEMLAFGRPKLAARATPARQVAADALQLPFGDAAFDAVTVAFGIRNFSDPSAGLREMSRVVRPGGIVAVLEFSRPRGPFGRLFDFYSRQILPRIGGLITGDRSAYEYLPASVSTFPEGREFEQLMLEAGLTQISSKRLTGGIATIYRGSRPE